MRTRETNTNEKTDRNRKIFLEREQGVQVVELSDKYGVSMPRIHRICMKEENKALKIQNANLLAELNLCKAKEK